MHGRKKPTEPPSAEERAAVAKKAAKYKALYSMTMAHRVKREMTPAAFELNTKMVLANPDVYHMWNFRREMIKTLFAAEDTIPDMVKGELRLTQEALGEKNPKSYPAWHHRQWIVQNYAVSLEKELELCAQFLTHDERNFHCWNYRRWVAARAAVPPKDEFAFTTEKINRNFSNYSAWHYRSHLLPLLTPEGKPDSMVGMDLLAPELELVQQACFTEPDDQSAWMYHRWLLAQLDKLIKAGGGDAERALEALKTELASLTELREAEEECKWPILASAVVLQMLSAAGGGASDAGEEATALYARLKTLDPFHVTFYKFAERDHHVLSVAGAPERAAPAS